MIETKERQFGEYAITVTQLPARRGMRLLRRVMQALAPALGDAASPALAAVTQGNGVKALAGLNLSSFGAAIERLFQNLDDATLDAILYDRECGALATARVNGKELLPVLDAIVGADLFLLMRIAAFALEVHFSSFFDAAREAAARAKAEAATAAA